MPFFYIIHIAVCVLLILIILFQDGKTGGLVSVADTGNSVFGAQGASSVLTKLTSGVAIAFMITSVFLAFLNAPGDESIADDYQPPAQTNSSSVEAQPQPGAQQPADVGDVVIYDENGKPVTKSFAETGLTQEVITDPSQLPPEILESERLLKEKAAAAAEKKKADDAKAKTEKPKTDKPKTEDPKKDQ